MDSGAEVLIVGQNTELGSLGQHLEQHLGKQWYSRL